MTDSTESGPHPTPPEFAGLIDARVQLDVLPRFPHLAGAWADGLRSWAVVEDHEQRLTAVDVFTTTLDFGRIHVARFDGSTLGLEFDDQGDGGPRGR